MLNPAGRSDRFFARFCLLTLVFVILVILWGALVRATGSGAGCGQHWPLCNGEMLPGLARHQTLIEFVHRATSGFSLLMVIGLGLLARRRFAKGHPARLFALLSVIGILVEAAIGAALVLLRLVEHDQSLDRAVSIALHLANTCFLVGALTLLVHASSSSFSGAAFPGPGLRRRQGLWVLGGFVVLAAAGAWTALGDTLFAASSLSEGWVRDWARDAHFLERLRIVHPILAVIWAGGSIAWLQSVGGLWPGRALGLILANLAIGALNVVLAAPLFLQILHLAVANLLWIALVMSFTGLRSGASGPQVLGAR